MLSFLESLPYVIAMIGGVIELIVIFLVVEFMSLGAAWVGAIGSALAGLAAVGALFLASGWRRQFIHKEQNLALLEYKRAFSDWWMAFNKTWQVVSNLPSPSYSDSQPFLHFEFGKGASNMQEVDSALSEQRGCYLALKKSTLALDHYHFDRYENDVEEASRLAGEVHSIVSIYLRVYVHQAHEGAQGRRAENNPSLVSFLTSAKPTEVEKKKLVEFFSTLDDKGQLLRKAEELFERVRATQAMSKQK